MRSRTKRNSLGPESLSAGLWAQFFSHFSLNVDCKIVIIDDVIAMGQLERDHARFALPGKSGWGDEEPSDVVVGDHLSAIVQFAPSLFAPVLLDSFRQLELGTTGVLNNLPPETPDSVLPASEDDEAVSRLPIIFDSDGFPAAKFCQWVQLERTLLSILCHCSKVCQGEANKDRYQSSKNHCNL